MSKESLDINYIFETSWEVCNKIGGIYTVLSTQAKELLANTDGNAIYIGPCFGNENNDTVFKESKTLLKSWKKQATEVDGLNVKIGKWNIPGSPVVILVDFKPFFSMKNNFFFLMWSKFGVNSLHSYGDYDESVIFGYAAAKVIESYCKFNKKEMDGKNIIAEFHEWTTASGLLYVKGHLPEVKTVFTTHATTVGRSICFNNKPLYKYFTNYNGDQMAQELNVEAKHSIEKKAAHFADCFTTVSDISAKECEQLLEKSPNLVTPNGFETDFVPKGKKFEEKRIEARANLTKVAEAVIGKKISKNAFFVATSGRYEFKNKGIDVFLESLKILSQNTNLKKEVIAFIMVPGYISGPRKDLLDKLNEKAKYQLTNNNYTHDLYRTYDDEVLSALRYYKMDNNSDSKVKVIFVPSYLDGKDGIFNMSYYDLLTGLDMTVFASYYEPWGYTPLESAAFGIPTATTNLSGFGAWVSKEPVNITNGVAVLMRTEDNIHELAEDIHNNILLLTSKKQDELDAISQKAKDIAAKASWKNFIKYSMESFRMAIKKNI